jgi:hypothetical protein
MNLIHSLGHYLYIFFIFFSSFSGSGFSTVRSGSSAHSKVLKPRKSAHYAQAYLPRADQ